MLINLPTEIILNIIDNFNDCRDVLALYCYDKYTQFIIDNHVNHIVAKLINNNIPHYYQMAQILKSCYRFKYNNIKDLHFIVIFVFENSKNDIIKNSNDFIKYRLNNNKIDNYYILRVFQKFTHNEALKTVHHLKINQIFNMVNLTKKGYNVNDAFEAAKTLNKEGIDKMLLIMQRGLNILNSIRVVDSFDDTGIEKVFELIKKNIPVENAIDAVEDLNDELIEVMLYLFRNGVDADTARCAASVFINEAKQNQLIYLINKGVEKDLVLDIIEHFDEEQITAIKDLMNIGVNCDIACNLIQLSDKSQLLSSDGCINRIMNLYKKGLDNHKLNHLINEFTEEQINKFSDLMNKNINYSIAIDAIEMFDESQTNKLIHLVNNNNISSETAFNSIIIFDDYQLNEFIKITNNGINEMDAFNIIKYKNEPNYKKVKK